MNGSYPSWQTEPTRRAAERMHDAHFALLQARKAWIAAGRPDTEHHKAESARLKAELERLQIEFSRLSRKDFENWNPA